jgi:hypothetical protein
LRETVKVSIAIDGIWQVSRQAIHLASLRAARDGAAIWNNSAIKLALGLHATSADPSNLPFSSSSPKGTAFGSRIRRRRRHSRAYYLAATSDTFPNIRASH